MKQPSFDLIELFVEHPCMDHFDWCLEQEVDLLSDASRERADAATLWAAMSLAGYHMDGRNTFVLGDRQVQVFGQLDVSRVCWSELTVPYGICYIAFERPVALVKEDGATAMEMSLAGFVVAQSVDQGSEDETLRLSLTPLFLEADGLSRGVVDFLLRLNIVAGRTLEAALAEYEGGVAEASRRFFQFAASCTGPLELSDVADGSRWSTRTAPRMRCRRTGDAGTRSTCGWARVRTRKATHARARTASFVSSRRRSFAVTRPTVRSRERGRTTSPR